MASLTTKSDFNVPATNLLQLGSQTLAVSQASVSTLNTTNAQFQFSATNTMLTVTGLANVSNYSSKNESINQLNTTTVSVVNETVLSLQVQDTFSVTGTVELIDGQLTIEGGGLKVNQINLNSDTNIVGTSAVFGDLNSKTTAKSWTGQDMTS